MDGGAAAASASAGEGKELRESLALLEEISLVRRASPAAVLAEALREWAARRGVPFPGEGPEARALAGDDGGAVSPAHGGDQDGTVGALGNAPEASAGPQAWQGTTAGRSVKPGSNWAQLPSGVEESIFVRLKGETTPHAARAVCTWWKVAVEHNVKELVGSPRGEQGLGCICYLKQFRKLEVLKLLVPEEDFEREQVLVEDLLGCIARMPNFKRLDMTEAEVHSSTEAIEHVAELAGFQVTWPVNEMNLPDEEEGEEGEEGDEEEEEGFVAYSDDDEDEEEGQGLMVDSDDDDEEEGEEGEPPHVDAFEGDEVLIENDEDRDWSEADYGDDANVTDEEVIEIDNDDYGHEDDNAY